MSYEAEEGAACPHADCSGHFEFYYPDDQGCTCFRSAPCGRCMSSTLICESCGFEPFDDNGDLIWVGEGIVYTGDGSIWVVSPGQGDGAQAPGNSCPYCALPAQGHPQSTGAPWLYRLCDGRLSPA